jgi:tellurite methyltransferase
VNDREAFLQRMESFYADTLHPWGDEPEEFVVEHVEELLPGTVLDLGSGDGRNALFLARRGFNVIAVDVVESALSELRRAASAAGLAVETHVAQIGEFPLAPTYENVLCTFTLHFLAADAATALVERLKERTAPGGCHLLALFAKDGPLYRPGSNTFWAEPSTLQTLYGDWEVVHSGQRIVETVATDEAGNPFQQPTDELVVRKSRSGE